MFRVPLTIVTVLALCSCVNAAAPRPAGEPRENAPTIAVADHHGCYYCAYYQRSNSYDPLRKYGCTAE
jgi:hypothetical protein